MSAWEYSLSGVGAQASVDEELRLIEETLERDDANVKGLMQRRKELIKLQQERLTVDVHTVRSLLRLCTGRIEWEGRVRGVVLTPDHPLVLRLRLVGDRILGKTLHELWTIGWDRRTLDDLEGALDEWGMPEPIHCYGFWDGAPLVFNSWLEEGFALFSPLGTDCEIDARGLGVRQVARELERYSSLFPAAADRLRLRLYGDSQGQWAWSVLSQKLDSPNFSADVELLTQLAPREPTAIDQGTNIDELRGRAFEPGVDGALPRIRVTRVRSTDATKSQVHVSAVVGELIEQLRSTITPMAIDFEFGCVRQARCARIFSGTSP